MSAQLSVVGAYGKDLAVQLVAPQIVGTWSNSANTNFSPSVSVAYVPLDTDLTKTCVAVLPDGTEVFLPSGSRLRFATAGDDPDVDD